MLAVDSIIEDSGSPGRDLIQCKFSSAQPSLCIQYPWTYCISKVDTQILCFSWCTWFWSPLFADFWLQLSSLLNAFKSLMPTRLLCIDFVYLFHKYITPALSVCIKEILLTHRDGFHNFHGFCWAVFGSNTLDVFFVPLFVSKQASWGTWNVQRRGMKLTPRELDHLRLSQVWLLETRTKTDNKNFIKTWKKAIVLQDLILTMLQNVTDSLQNTSRRGRIRGWTAGTEAIGTRPAIESPRGAQLSATVLCRGTGLSPEWHTNTHASNQSSNQTREIRRDAACDAKMSQLARWHLFDRPLLSWQVKWWSPSLRSLHEVIERYRKISKVQVLLWWGHWIVKEWSSFKWVTLLYQLVNINASVCNTCQSHISTSTYQAIWSIDWWMHSPELV